MAENIAAKKILLDALQKRISFVSDADNTMDQKAATLLGFSAAIGVGFITFMQNSPWSVLSTFGLLSLLISAILFIIGVIRSRDYETGAIDLKEHPEYYDMSEEGLIEQLLSDVEYACGKNTETLMEKEKTYRRGLILLIFGLILLIIPIIPIWPKHQDRCHLHTQIQLRRVESSWPAYRFFQ